MGTHDRVSKLYLETALGEIGKSEAVNEKLEEVIKSAFLDLPVVDVKRKRRPDAIAAIFDTPLRAVRKHGNFSPAWALPMKELLLKVWKDHDLPALEAAKKAIRTVVEVAFVPSSPTKDASREDMEAIWKAEWEQRQAASGKGQKRKLSGDEDGTVRKKKKSHEKSPDFLDKLQQRLTEFGGRRAASESGDSSSDGSRSSRSSASSGQERKRRKKDKKKKRIGRKAGRDLAEQFQRLEWQLADPVALLKRAGLAVEERPDWPLVGQTGNRLAPFVIPQLYGSHRRATEWAASWATKKFVSGTHVATTMYRYAMALDYMLLYDYPRGGSNPLNCVAAEIIARDLYGIMQAHEHIQAPSDLQNQKGSGSSKVRWKARDQYDCAAIALTHTIRAHDADKKVARHARDRNAINKLFGE